jgi:D-alanyl-D-alanine carboxypeptidase/D-alanyl-D-alanine-endopeptidase (penicillin-binding protein 4)
MERLKIIFATGGTGTLESYYKSDSGHIYAKTGTLGGVVALSGYLLTEKRRLLIFSILVNNHRNSATTIRRKIESFLLYLMSSY